MFILIYMFGEFRALTFCSGKSILFLMVHYLSMYLVKMLLILLSEKWSARIQVNEIKLHNTNKKKERLRYRRIAR